MRRNSVLNTSSAAERSPTVLCARMAVLRFPIPIVAALVAGTVLGQTSNHVAEVRKAQGAAYAIRNATNGCPVVGADMLGWPGSMIRKCVYHEGPKGNRLTGLVY